MSPPRTRPARSPRRSASVPTSTTRPPRFGRPSLTSTSECDGAFPRERRPERWLVTTETLTREGQVLSTAIITWTFEATSSGTRVDLVDQVVSFVGQGMIDGHRNGHEICLRQLGEHLIA